jgi:hypothetical protein
MAAPKNATISNVVELGSGTGLGLKLKEADWEMPPLSGNCVGSKVCICKSGPAGEGVTLGKMSDGETRLAESSGANDWSDGDNVPCANVLLEAKIINEMLPIAKICFKFFIV